MVSGSSSLWMRKGISGRVLILLFVEYGVGWLCCILLLATSLVLILLFVEQVTNFRISESANRPCCCGTGCVEDARCLEEAVCSKDHASASKRCAAWSQRSDQPRASKRNFTPQPGSELKNEAYLVQEES